MLVKERQTGDLMRRVIRLHGAHLAARTLALAVDPCMLRSLFARSHRDVAMFAVVRDRALGLGLAAPLVKVPDAELLRHLLELVLQRRVLLHQRLRAVVG